MTVPKMCRVAVVIDKLEPFKREELVLSELEDIIETAYQLLCKQELHGLLTHTFDVECAPPREVHELARLLLIGTADYTTARCLSRLCRPVPIGAICAAAANA